MHSPAYMRPSGGWITNDFKWRRAQAGMSGDGTSSAPSLPSLPAGNASAWLKRYHASTDCTWRFDLPDSGTGSSITFTLR